MAQSVRGIRSRQAGSKTKHGLVQGVPKTKHGLVQAGQKNQTLAQKMPGRVPANTAGSMTETLERTISSVIRDNFVASSIDLDPPNTEDGQIMFKVTDMLKYVDVRGLSTAGVYVTRIATHPDIPEYIIFAYVERGRKPKAS